MEASYGNDKPTSSAISDPIAAAASRKFLSAQRRYDNLRVRENEIKHRLCCDCGKIVNGDDMAFQQHVVSHEAAYLCYQLYHYEKGTMYPREGFNQVVGSKHRKPPKNPPQETKRLPKNATSPKKPKKSLRDTLLKQFNRRNAGPLKFKPMIQKKPKVVLPPPQKRLPEDDRFLNDTRDDELNLSTDGSDDSDSIASDNSTPSVASEVGQAEAMEEEHFSNDRAVYVPHSGLSSRGRQRKPKLPSPDYHP